MSPLQLNSLLPLHYRHGFHSRLGNLNRPLRYFLGGIRPKQTTYQILFPRVFAAQVRTYNLKGWYFTVEYARTEILTITSPTYATQLIRTPNIKL
jgi:hypothetical protein